MMRAGRAAGVRVIPSVAAFLLAACGQAFAQQSPSGGQPFDVNSVRPGQPGLQRVTAAATSALGRTEAAAEQGPSYKVSRFLIEYRTEHPQHPAIDGVMNARVQLSQGPDGYLAPRAGEPTSTVRLADIMPANPGVFSQAALSVVAKGIVEQLQRQGLASIIVQLHPDDIDSETGADKRPSQDGDLRMIVWTGEVGSVRSVAVGERLENRIAKGTTTRVDSNDAAHTRIREQSPVKAGELVSKGAIDDYVYRLNRHPGRRVDVSVAPGEQEGQVALDYLINEAKPWTIYAQASNTGTENTNDWRYRVGFSHNQLTGNDDILRVDAFTAGVDEANGIQGSYDFPLRSDVLRLKFFGGYSEYDASDVGASGEAFSGQNYNVGAELAYTAYQNGRFFLDGIFGARYNSVQVTNDLFLERGEEQYFTPFIGARAERVTDVSETFASLTFEWMASNISGVNLADLNSLGRPGADEEWQIIRFDGYHSFYLEPLFSDVYKGKGDKGRKTLAHEIALSARGQYAFNTRLIPNEQDVIGGFFSVRGYPESVVAGDSSLVGTLEYRFHYPRTFAISDPGTLNGRDYNRLASFLGKDFRYAPQEAFGRADWDLIFKGFVDAGTVLVSGSTPGEDNYTLIGTGVGAELQVKRNLVARLDWGLALTDVDDPANRVDSGDNRFHFLLTLLY